LSETSCFRDFRLQAIPGDYQGRATPGAIQGQAAADDYSGKVIKLLQVIVGDKLLHGDCQGIFCSMLLFGNKLLRPS
jgi:hypothetical protein